MKLIITIDTEEDNWEKRSSDGAVITHLDGILRLQDIFDSRSFKPTYLITYPMATDKGVIKTLGEIESSGRCEIGNHCHPWNTPPFDEKITDKNSMLCNLTSALQYKKIKTLHDVIEDNFSITPLSFRAGRWGYCGKVAANLEKLGYRVDSSITAYTDWSEYHGPDFSHTAPDAFRFFPGDVFIQDNDGPLLEVPATVGFLQENFKMSNAILKTIKNTPLQKLRMKGILHKTGLVNQISLSPELASLDAMKGLTTTMIKKGYRIINMFFHSPSLKEGLSPFVRTKEDRESFLSTIDEYLRFANGEGVGSITLAESVKYI